MPKPREELKSEDYLKETFLFYEAFSRVCQDPESSKRFLKEILTPSELRMLKRRWFIARLLFQGKSVRAAAYEARVSTATVVRVSRILNNGTGMLKEAIKKVKPRPPRYPEAPKKYIFGQE